MPERVKYATLVLLWWIGWGMTSAHAECGAWVATLVSVEGQVEWRQSGEAAWKPAAAQAVFCAQDSLRTGAHGRAAITLHDHTIVRLKAGTTVTFVAPDGEGRSWLDLFRGAAYFLSRVTRKLTVTTPFVNAGVEGTEFLVEADDEAGLVAVYEGKVRASNEHGELLLAAGQAARAGKGQAPVLELLVHPLDAVQWTLYYPVFFLPDSQDFAGKPWSDALARSVELHAQGRIAEARDALSAIRMDEVDDPRVHVYGATLELAVGEVNAASAALRRALDVKPDDADALALQAVVAIVRNDRENGLALARRAVAAEPRDATAQLALSYAHQARFDLQQALEAAEKAVQLAPDDAHAWARLAEIRLMFRDIDSARAAAKRAVTLAPRQARALTVLGFSELLRTNTGAAIRRFDDAAAADPGAPLPRLGLGLARIRDGQLSLGRRELEIAVALDPGSALLRSYLGKAYAEEFRDEPAEEQFDLAKALDPQDPTPWLYAGLLRFEQNRPVEAFRQFQESIARNDARAVYRSRLMLDDDAATRNTSLARVYSDLGFGDSAERHATRSLSVDPGNFAAHRFLSDVYQGRPRHEIARASELLQSQLLQPLGMNAVQPQAAETNLNILAATAPSAGFNEFTPLFSRNALGSRIYFGAGSNETFSEEVVLAGMAKRYAFSIGQFHYETDGFRQNANVAHDIYNIFLQSAVTTNVDVQFEYRSRDTDQGDLSRNLSGDFLRDFHTSLDQDTARVGVHYAPRVGQDLLVSLVYSKGDAKSDLLLPAVDLGGGFIVPISVQDRALQEGYSSEVQYLLSGERYNMTLGGGYQRIDALAANAQVADPDGFPIPLADDRTRDTSYQANGYVYANLLAPRAWTWTLGLAYDGLDEGIVNVDRLSPKFGVQWDVTSAVRLRGAALSATKRQFLINQSLEPTQVAGFNQFFDDDNGADSELVGVGVDAALSANVSAGVEYTQRDIQTAVPNFDLSSLSSIGQSESLLHGYVNWAISSLLALSSGFDVQRLDNTDDAIDTRLTLDTHRVPLRLRYFQPDGWMAGTQLTWIHQELDDSRAAAGTVDSTEFTVWDLSVGYRLSKRRGVVSLDINNVLDRQFEYQDLSLFTADELNRDQRYIPERTIMARATFNL